jgi:hypothetical protein
LPFPTSGIIDRGDSPSRTERLANALSPTADKKLHLFQMDWRMDKIARRNANCGNKRLFGLTYH